VVLLAPLR